MEPSHGIFIYISSIAIANNLGWYRIEWIFTPIYLIYVLSPNKYYDSP